MVRLPDRWRGFQGIEGLPLIVVATNGVVYLWELLEPGLISWLSLSPAALRAGEWWRLATFLFVPPGMHPLFMVFWLMLLHTYASALEAQWGSLRFTVYYLAGWAATALVAAAPLPGVISNAYLNASLFLAFAALFPDFEVLLFFILPVKIKYLGYVTWGWMALSFLAGSALTRLTVAAALANYALLFGPDIWEGIKLRWQVHQNRRRWK